MAERCPITIYKRNQPCIWFWDWEVVRKNVRRRIIPRRKRLNTRRRRLSWLFWSTTKWVILSLSVLTIPVGNIVLNETSWRAKCLIHFVIPRMEEWHLSKSNFNSWAVCSLVGKCALCVDKLMTWFQTCFRSTKTAKFSDCDANAQWNDVELVYSWPLCPIVTIAANVVTRWFTTEMKESSLLTLLFLIFTYSRLWSKYSFGNK